ncbi:2-C-methyl-D-erythritol 2,4-cyclodiphosphate synthase [Natronospirillum operosum]|uniref:2-C-methyl-D-erythritol 2,4-cyclodiphosphate synthase n=1 Tax=Natronospirillum operosum TaxID=2759953 RepID=A0A4Z0WAH5_9GAMM|nr:2-C-methyl-D-erythritol 2,4-cyclodiphosphate synthase [Natronospirillum operosum]TGG95142.1 2-C-methyl-D-erythritol 2,4-cyclodiphosphate synthase [Natronospirillum operosum]
MTDLRIGHGYDVHRFATDPGPATQKLGGLDVPVDYPLLAHSDGDVVLHAICDAILGALALGDIGTHFPDTDARWAGADSTELLRQVWSQATASGYGLGNLDVTIVAQTPRLQGYKGPMAEHIAQVLGAQRHQVNVKATTTEKLGFVGRREGIATHAVVLLAGRE